MYAPLTFIAVEDRALQESLKDPLLHDLHNRLNGDDSSGYFLQLYKYGKAGKLDNLKFFKEITRAMADFVRRSTDVDRSNAKFGQRYSRDYLNFMTVLRHAGGNTAKQYEIVTAQIGGPSSRHLRSVVLEYHSYENYAHYPCPAVTASTGP